MQKKQRLSVSALRWYSHHLRFLHWQPSGRVWIFLAGVGTCSCEMGESGVLGNSYYWGWSLVTIESPSNTGVRGAPRGRGAPLFCARNSGGRHACPRLATADSHG